MRILAFVAALTIPCIALAGEKPRVLPEIITFDGYAFAYQDNWKAKDLAKRGKVVVYDVVSAWRHNVQTADCKRHELVFRGAKWCFASRENLEEFAAATDSDGENHFLPFAGGRCAAGLSDGMLAARGHPLTARVATDLFGNAILVLHSGEKWWFDFDATKLKMARLAWALATGPRIAPND